MTSLNRSVMLVALKARQNPPEENGDSATKSPLHVFKIKFIDANDSGTFLGDDFP